MTDETNEAELDPGEVAAVTLALWASVSGHPLDYAEQFPLAVQRFERHARAALLASRRYQQKREALDLASGLSEVPKETFVPGFHIASAAPAQPAESVETQRQFSDPRPETSARQAADAMEARRQFGQVGDFSTPPGSSDQAE